jgi:hypothetical protein
MSKIGVAPHVKDLVLNHVDASVTGVHYDMHDYAVEKMDAVTRLGDYIERLVHDPVKRLGWETFLNGLDIEPQVAEHERRAAVSAKNAAKKAATAERARERKRLATQARRDRIA